MKGDLRRIFLEGCVLIAFGALVGLTLNYQLVIDAFCGGLTPEQCRAEEAESAAVITTLPLPALIGDVQDASSFDALIVDARSPELYEAGHILGAVSLPIVEIDSALPEFLKLVARDRPIITYCAGFGCPDSFDLGVLLIKEGFQDVRVFEGGYPEWRDAGLPVTGESR
jgi:rhodanese-related sulfurtransferase